MRASSECGRAGASGVLAGRNGAKLDRLYDEMVALGAPQPAIAQLDLASATAQDYDQLSDTIDREFGKLDGLVHAAALLGDRTPIEHARYMELMVKTAAAVMSVAPEKVYFKKRKPQQAGKQTLYQA